MFRHAASTFAKNASAAGPAVRSFSAAARFKSSSWWMRYRLFSVRDGKRENAKASENRGFSLRVFRGAKVASVSTNDDSDIDTLVERVGRNDKRPLLRGGNE